MYIQTLKRKPVQVNKTDITSKSVAQSGLPTDYKRAIAEYVWNGFDAGATRIDIDFVSNNLGYIQSFKITDNGSGISLDDLSQTFGKFLDSQKKTSFDPFGQVKGKKGKGRYAFGLFCTQIRWITRFNSKNTTLQYEIVIEKGSQDKYQNGSQVVARGVETGTEVHFSNFVDFTTSSLESTEFENFLCCEFGWLLFLNQSEDFQINLNGVRLDYNQVIDHSRSYDHEIGEHCFQITFLRWNQKIGDKYYFYFLDETKKSNHKTHTSFNNKAIDFHHSVYINSPYFNNFKLTGNNLPKMQFDTIDQTDNVYKQIQKHLHTLVLEEEKSFIRVHQAQKLVSDFHRKKIFPVFKSNAYEQVRLKDLENVVMEIYCVQPKIFENLKLEQSKTIVGFLNLLLDSEQRDKILDILEGIVKLTDDERTELAKTLERTKFAGINSLLKLLISRTEIVSLIKELVFELSAFTTERDHIQKVIESNYWLFGEQYHLVSADDTFERTLNNYLTFIESGKKEKKVLTQKSKNRRPDIFICRKQMSPERIETNILVELKRPSVTIGKEQFSQIEDYLRFVVEQPQFNSILRNWKFILVGKALDTYMRDKIEANVAKGKLFLADAVKNYEIYAMTWDDLFKTFELGHMHLISQLELKPVIIDELKARNLNLGKELADEITAHAIAQ